MKKTETKYIIRTKNSQHVTLYWTGFVWSDAIDSALRYTDKKEAEFKRKQFINAEILTLVEWKLL